ncbi:MAG: hypothetical protein V5A55_08180 [Halovenus sp.]
MSAETDIRWTGIGLQNASVVVTPGGETHLDLLAEPVEPSQNWGVATLRERVGR